MAKFSIALCILLVACGAQATTISASSVKLSAETQIAQVEELLQSADVALSNATASTKQMIASVGKTLQISLVEWNKMVGETVANYVNGSSCISTSANFTKVTTETFLEVIHCMVHILASNTVKYEAAVNSSEVLIAEINEMVTEAEACEQDALTSVSCLAKLEASEGSEITTAMATFSEEIAEITATFDNNTSDLQTCGYSDAIQTVVTEGQEDYTTIEDCLANLNSTSS